MAIAQLRIINLMTSFSRSIQLFMIKTPILTRVYGLALVEISRDGIRAGTGGGLVF